MDCFSIVTMDLSDDAAVPTAPMLPGKLISSTAASTDVQFPGDRQPLSSAMHIFGNAINAIVGAGVLGLPFAFMKAGWLAGFLLLATAALLSWWGMMLLVYSKRKFVSQLAPGDGITTFGELAKRVFGTPAEITVDMLILLAHGGFCVAYLIFIGENLSSIVSGGTSMKTPFILGIGEPYGADWLSLVESD